MWDRMKDLGIESGKGSGTSSKLALAVVRGKLALAKKGRKIMSLPFLQSTFFVFYPRFTVFYPE